MKKQNKATLTNQAVVVNFFNGIVDVLSKNTSKNYSLVVLGKIKKDLLAIYPFFKYVHFDSGKIKADPPINDIETHKIGKFCMEIIDILGPSLLKVMIMEELDSKTVKYLERIGVKFLESL